MAALAVAAAVAQVPQPQPFRTGVDVAIVEATVVDRAGKVVPGLGPGDFTVEVGGRPREVVSAELVEYATTTTARTAAPSGAPSFDLDITSNVETKAGRVVLLVVDQESLRSESRHVLDAAKRWVSTLAATDRVGLVGLPPPGPRVEFTTEHAKVADGLGMMMPRAGIQAPPFNRYNISIWEALRIRDRDMFVRGEVVTRECPGVPLCPLEIDTQADSMAMDSDVQVAPVLGALRGLVRGMAALPGPKHLVLLSSGWPISEREAASQMAVIAADAAQSNVTVHTFTAEQWAMSASRSRQVVRLMEDRNLLLTSVEMLSSLTGGRSVRLVGAGDAAFTSLSAGLAGYYRLGVRIEPDDLDGKSRRISLKVLRPGASLSGYRRVLPAAAKTAAATDPASVMREALRGGTSHTGLDLRATSYVLQGEAAGPALRVIVVGDVGRAAAGPAKALAGLYDLEGKAVALTEHAVDVPAAGPAALTLALTAPPGAYLLRIVVRDTDGHLGTLERHVDARWTKAGAMETPGLVLFGSGPATGRTPRPLFHSVTTADQVIAQVALSGVVPDPLPQVVFAVTREGSPAALITRTGRLGKATGGTTVAEEIVPASMLPPGRYILSATIRPGDAAPFTRAFVVEPAAPTAAPSAAGPASRGVPTAFAKPPRFTTAVVLEPGFVSPLLDQLAARPDVASVREALEGMKAGPWRTEGANGPLASAPVAAQFVTGLARLQRGELEEAATAFRAALQSAPDFGPALTLLGACYAAGAKDKEAASAWQMALVRDRTSPILQRLAIEAWMRADRPAAAQALITQARGRWPDDDAFVRLAAQVAIADGRVPDGLELIATLRQPDQQTLLSALATVYEAARRKSPVWDPTRDLETMRRLREAYAATGGESLTLVDAWLAEMTRKGPGAP